MGYAEKVLTDGEEIIGRSKCHWGTLTSAPIAAVIYFSISVAIGEAVIFFSISDAIGDGSFLHWRTAAERGVLLFAVMGIWAFGSYISSEFVLTNKRIIMKQGVIKRKSVDIHYEQVESVTLNQAGLEGMLFDCGNIKITGTGSSTQLEERFDLRPVFRGIDNPFEFKKIIDSELDKVRDTSIKE